MKHWGWFLGAGLLTAVLIATLLSPFASPWPDGLEKVAATLGFAPPAAPADAPLADYAVPGVRRRGLSTALAGLLGTLAVFAAGYALARWAAAGTKRERPPE